MTTTSIIVPTLDRNDDLRCLLNSLIVNSQQPDEVIVVEQGDVQKTSQLATEFNLNVRVFSLDTKSLTLARNLGIKQSSGDIVIFLDDDVVVSNSYIRETVVFFEQNPISKGITGLDAEYLKTRHGVTRFVKRLIGCLFGRSVLSGPSRVLRSGHNVLQNYSKVEQVVEWLPGCAASWRRTVFEEGFKYNENFIRWSFGEDVMFSYRVFKKYSNALRYVPTIHYNHFQSQQSRMNNPQILRMQVIYRYIFWREEVYNRSIISTFLYIWSQAGFVLLTISVQSISSINSLLKAYFYLMVQRDAIIHNRVNYNDFILSGNGAIDKQGT